MYIYTLCQQILRDMWARKLRSVLALLGIICGTTIVIMLLALGEGFREASQKDMMTIVDGTFFVLPGKTSKSYQGFPKGQSINVKASAIINMPNEITGIKMSSPMLMQKSNFTFGNKTVTKGIFGVSENYYKLRKINLIQNSRFLNKLDVANQTRVVILGDKVKNNLFGEKPALGKQIKINGINFTVIGVMQKPTKNVYNWHGNSTIIPYSTFITLFGDINVRFFIAFPNPNIEARIAEQSMRGYLAHRYHFAKDDKMALQIFNTTKMYQFMRYFFMGIQIFLGICGGLTLAVGSLGVTNIMFLIVSERTREIGTRLAIGATSKHILFQIIMEALIIVSIGGLIGFSLSLFTITILQYINLPEWLGKPVLSGNVAIATISIIAILGTLAGYFPAKRASKMDPVEALGY